MAIDQDTLNVLNRIEKILADANRSTGGMAGGATKSGGASRYDSTSARAEESQLQSTKRISVSTGKSVERLGLASQDAGKRLEDFKRKTGQAGIGLDGLTSVVTRSIAQISAQRADLSKIDMSTTLSALQSAVQDATTSIKTSNLAKGDTTGFAKTIGTLDDLIDNKVNPRLGSFNSALHLASQSLVGLWGDLREQRRDGGAEMKEFAKGIGAASSALSRKQGVGEYFDKFILQLRKANVALRELRSGARSGGGGDGGGGRRSNRNDDADPTEQNKNRKSLTSVIVNGFKKTAEFAFAAAAARVITSAVEIVNQAFQVTGERGFGVLDSNFLTLSKNAVFAGMSLKDYAQMMDKNEGLVSRSSSFAAFDKQLDVGRDGLKKFGIFGAEATNLSAAMAGSAQTLGVPVEDLTNSMNGQMKVFEELRRTTGLTADQFAEMNRNLQNNDDVQRELIGLEPNERAARLSELTRTSAMGKALGLTEQNANKLTAAMLAQRKSTVKERFEGSGRLRQSMSLVGMDPSDIAEAAALAGKRMKTPEEDARYNELLGKYNSRAEEIKQNGGPGMANAVESSEALLTPQVKASMDAAVAVQAAKDSGKQANPDMNKTLGPFQQALGNLGGILEGIGKSSVAQLAIGVASLAASALAIFTQNVGTAAQVANTTAQVANTTALLTLPQRIALAIAGMSSGPGGKVGSAILAGSDLSNASTSLGADGSGGIASEGAKKAGRFGRVGAALGKAGSFLGSAKGMGIVGSVAGAGLAAYQYNKADENAKVENGGDGDVGKLKGEAIGEGIGLAAGTIAGSFLGPIGAMIIGPLGGWAGKLIGGFLGSENATEKNNRQVSNLTKEMIESRRKSAGSDVISSNNLSSLASNVLQTGKAYADNTEEQKKAIQDDLNKKNGTGQTGEGKTEGASISTPTYDAMGNVTGSETIENDRIKSNATPAAIPVVTPTASTASTTSIVTPIAAATQAIATPVSAIPTSVNQGAVNSAATTAVTAAAASTTTVAAASTLAPTDQASTLAEILKILQQSLMAENTQVDLVSQLLRSPAFATRLMDTNVLMDRAIRTA